MEINMRQLRYFLTIARTGNMTRAGQELYISQPTLSQSLARLEKSLGGPLFERKQGALFLNDAGRKFYARVERILADLELASAEVRDLTDRKDEQVKMISSIHNFFCEMIINLYRQFPGLQLVQKYVKNNQIERMLTTDQADVALSFTSIQNEEIDCMPLLSEEIFLLAGKSHPLSGRKQVALDEISGFDLACNQEDIDSEFIGRLFSCVERKPKILLETFESRSLQNFIQSTNCLSFIPARVALRVLKFPEEHRETAIKIMDAPLQLTTYISHKKNRSVARNIEEFLRLLFDFSRQMEEELRTYMADYFMKQDSGS